VHSPAMLALIAASFLLAGFVKGVIGLGLPTVAIGLLGLLMTPAQAAAIIVVPSLVTNLWQFVGGGALIDLLRRMWPLLAGVCAGTLIGALWVPPGGPDATFWLGVALALYAGLGLANVRFSVPAASETWLGALIGGLTGIVSVATGVLAIPSAPYIQALKFDRDRLVQALGLSFSVSTAALAFALAHAGEVSSGLLLPSAIALVSGIAGMLLGQIVRGKVKAETFRLIFLLGLLLLGGHLALNTLI
jgi:uncharacterized membrane protein YfcA